MYSYLGSWDLYDNEGNGLNPYSGGKCIHIIQSGGWRCFERKYGLNPYSGGKCIHMAASAEN